MSSDNMDECRTFFDTVSRDKTLERFDYVHDTIVSILEKNDDQTEGEIVKIMKLFNDGQSDRGVIRTILMTLKPVRGKLPGLDSLYLELASRLKLKDDV